MGHQVVREYVYALTAVCPQQGKMTSLVLPWLDAQTMSVFLEYTAREFRGVYCIILLDGAGWHRAGDLRVPQTMKLLPLPPYSPELNPVEHIWDYLRENTFKNIAFDSLDDVIEALCGGLKTLHDSPDLVRSMTSFTWFNTLCMTDN